MPPQEGSWRVLSPPFLTALRITRQQASIQSMFSLPSILSSALEHHASWQAQLDGSTKPHSNLNSQYRELHSVSDPICPLQLSVFGPLPLFSSILIFHSHSAAAVSLVRAGVPVAEAAACWYLWLPAPLPLVGSGQRLLWTCSLPQKHTHISGPSADCCP